MLIILDLYLATKQLPFHSLWLEKLAIMYSETQQELPGSSPSLDPVK